MRYIHIFFILLISISSCSKQSTSFPQEVFKDSATISLSKEIALEQYHILCPSSVLRYKGWTFFMDEVSKNCLRAISPGFKKGVGRLRLGNGPCDVSNYRQIFLNNDSLFVHDPNLRKILSVDVVDDSIVIKPYKTCNARTGSLIPINESRFVSVDYSDSSLFKIVDLNDSAYFRQPYPQDGVLDGLPFLSQNSIYGNIRFAISPSKAKIAFGVMDNGTYGFGRIITRDSIQFDSIIYYYPLIIGSIEDLCVIPDKNNINNINSAASSEDYVFFAHNGTRNPFALSNKILVYKWNGEPYKILNFKESPRIASFNYDAERNVLYGIGANPERYYFEIDLNGILE